MVCSAIFSVTSMTIFRTAILVSLALTMPVAAQAPTLQPGAYEVKASLELPNIDDLNVNTVRTLCLVAQGGAANHGFAVMSENNPLAHCAMVDVHEQGDTLTFAIKCTGSNLAKASATYLLMGDRFRGRIAMTMGGKNMTMTEVQEGHRVGACQPPS